MNSFFLSSLSFLFFFNFPLVCSFSSSARKFLFIRVLRFRLPSCCLLIDGLIFLCSLSLSLSLSVVSFLGFKDIDSSDQLMCVRVSARAPLSFVSLISFIFLFLYRRIHWRRFATSLNPKQIVSFKLITDSSILVMARIKAAVAHKWYLSFP